MARERGQASLEYLAVVGVVALVLAGAAVPALAGRDVAGGVVRQVHRALCVVRGGDCEEDRRPCVTASDSVRDDRRVDLAVLRLGSRTLVLRERRSDGTVLVTLLHDADGGLALALGGGLHARLGGRTLRAGYELDASVLALAGAGTTWELADEATADRLVERLAGHGVRGALGRLVHGVDLHDFPPPAREQHERGLEAQLGGSLSRGPAALALGISSADVASESVDRRTGERSLLVRRRNELVGSLAVRSHDLASGTVGGDALFTVRLDPSGRPLDLGVVRGRELHGSVELPGPAREVLGALGVATNGARRWETEQHLDLTDPDNLAVARAFLAQVVSPRPRFGAAVAVSDALRARLDAAGVMDARVYALEDAQHGVEVEGEARGVKLGGGWTRDRATARLLAAAQRGPDGLWHRREDCLSAAA